MHLPFVHLVYCGSDRYLHFYKNQGQGRWKRLRFAFKGRIHTHKPWTLTFLLSLSKILVLKISRQGTAWLWVSRPVNCCTMLPNVLYSSNYFEISVLPFHPKYTRSLQKNIIKPTDTIAFNLRNVLKKFQIHKDEATSQNFSFIF